MKKYKTYTSEFKRSIIEQIDSGAISLCAAARENNISHSLIEYWRKQLHEGTFQDRPTAREKQLEKELDRYKKKVGELTIQIDLLKKNSESSTYMRKWNGYIVTGKKSEPSERDAE